MTREQIDRYQASLGDPLEPEGDIIAPLVTRHLWLLGPARVDQIHKAQNGARESKASEVPRFRSRRTVALLGYLAAERRPFARDFLAALFWPDETTSKGRSNLRRELHNLTQILPNCWELDRQVVTFVPSADVIIDLYSLLQLEAEERWQEAAELLGGEFLEGLHLDDNPEFENWLLGERERWRGRAEALLGRVIDGHMRRGQYSDALCHTRRMLQITPWNEEAHRRAIRLLMWTGQRGAALRQFETCEQVLWEELGVEPTRDTIALYQQVRAGRLDLPPQLPAFLTEEGARYKVDRPLFVAREHELAQLDMFFTGTLAGQGRVVFVAGGPGRGKTMLMAAFAQRAMEAHPDLLVASGNCSAYSGVGDPYLPFRDVMAMLSGDVEAKWDAGAITRDHAQRIWTAFPLALQALLDHGLHLLDVLVSGTALLSRAMIAEGDDTPGLARLREHINRREVSSQDVEQSYLFQEVTNVLYTVAREQPLLLILDDMQWADEASISLLFHLGRRIARTGGRLLLVCAYRPEEVTLDRSGGHHSLVRVLSEFKRAFGNMWVDLDQTDRIESRRFIDALLDTEPNRLCEGFRVALSRRTEGHPLFTVELLRAMKEQGGLYQDEDGCWIEGPTLDWKGFPARVEAVIEQRIDRLDPELHEILNIASVEGETFTAQAVAQVQGIPERLLLRRLSLDLERRHRLVKEQEEVQTDRRRVSRYRFSHALFQAYVYSQLGQGERRLLHGNMGVALEELYAERLDEMAVPLAHHFDIADEYDRALHYFSLAAKRAARLHANHEAIALYTRSIELTEKVSLDIASLTGLYRGRGLAYETVGKFERARTDHEMALQIARATGERHVEWCALLDLGKLWASRNQNQTLGYFERALELAYQMDDPVVLADSLNWMGNWYINAENTRMATQYHLEALEIVETLQDRQSLANTLDLLGIANLLGGDLAASIQYYGRAIALFRELGNRHRLASSLMGRATSVAAPIWSALSLSSLSPDDAIADFNEVLEITREIDLVSEKTWVSWSMGLFHTMHGHFGQALKGIQDGLRIASEVGHREWIVGNQWALSLLYGELLAPEKALQQLETALPLARELCSQIWIRNVTGALARAYILLDDLASAQTCLETVLSPQTPMDALGKRLCWARWAELALAQGDPVLALDIADRLIASVPGMLPGQVVAFLWKLKGEALTAMGETEEACSLLHAALENAQATGERFLLWRIRASLGWAYHAAGCQEKAQQELLAAREFVQELADTISDETLSENLVQRACAILEAGDRVI